MLTVIGVLWGGILRVMVGLSSNPPVSIIFFQFSGRSAHLVDGICI